jgi:shikimate dehydrogenase
MVAGVIGRPIGHSLSPALHGAWIQALGLDAIYAPFESTDAGFESVVRGLRIGGVRGLNVTLPFKELALGLSDRASEEAQAAGAANVLLFTAEGVEARNTDCAGLLAAFDSQAPGHGLSGGAVVVLGAGGAARAACATLAAVRVGELRIVNRTAARAKALAERFDGRAFGLDRAAAAFDGVTAIINTTSAGLADTEEIDWPLDAAPEHAAVMDMVYNPLRTPLLAKADRLGMVTVDGLGMLIGQARPSFEAFFGVPPPAAVEVRPLLEGLLK